MAIESPDDSSNSRPAHLPRAELIQAAIRSIPDTVLAAEQTALSDFIASYYLSAPIADLNRYSPTQLYRAAEQHWQLCKQRQPKQINLQAFNPTTDINGWESPHTVIQLVIADQSHLLSTLRSQLVTTGHAVNLVIHPIFSVTRSDDQLTSATLLDARAQQDDVNESVLRLDIDRVADDKLAALEQQLNALLVSFQQWQLVQPELFSYLEQLSNSAASTNHQTIAHYLAKQRFACFGIAEFNMQSPNDAINAQGLLNTEFSDKAWQLSELISDEDLTAIQQVSDDFIWSKGSSKIPFIRNEHVDIVLLLNKDAKGVTSCICIAGLLLTRSAGEVIANLPPMKLRIEEALAKTNTLPDSHDGKALSEVLHGFPRNMLLQAEPSELQRMAEGIVALQERQQTRLFSSVGPLQRFCNCLIYIPRDDYSRELRLKLEAILVKEIDGNCTEFKTQLSSVSALARLHIIIEKSAPYNRAIDWKKIEKRIQEASVSWEGQLTSTLHNSHDSSNAAELFKKYRNSFPANYKEHYTAAQSVADIDFIEKQTTDTPQMGFYRPADTDGYVNFKLVANHEAVTLSNVLPVIENFGLRIEAENAFEIKRDGHSTVWVHEFTAQHTGHQALEADQAAAFIETAFGNVWLNTAENDGFNQLILSAGLTWRQVVILRSYCRYLLQINVPFSQEYMIDSLVANPLICKSLVSLFETRFTPSLSQRDSTIESSIKEALNDVASLDEDRILRAYLNAIKATLRTNYYCQDKDGNPYSYISYKLDSQAIPDLPLPRPMVEIFVYSPEVEGIHLRGGKVARGGLRWSDRREDFRTEVLGLMKAQMVKNAVIVPQGSKGGFYVKLPAAADRDTQLNNAVHCYKLFLSGMLDITDNIVDDQIVPPTNVVRYDDNDPYLVVAADKGTATFSDYANAVSQDYGFWLGDAFASGGSVGYDHKKMGITARGAWESVKRHFRGLGTDTQSQPFTVAAIGDMAGDVFGNGMLLSPHIKLVAAFNHQHIFIDPNPDTTESFDERQRLFALPRSSWSDYNEKLLSKGGAIYARSEKQIELSAEACEALGCVQTTFTPNELITAILKSTVDLMWNGGIGTYFKASHETNAQAADRANDGLRINGAQMRCKVFGEGGNLGATQLARIEFAEHGGLVYNDAIDNCAGVNCSDHEVNIKILLNKLVAANTMTLEERDKLLESMTFDVAQLVLRDNYIQTQCIDLSHAGGNAALEEYARFMQHLVNAGKLDREIEYLPDAEQIADRLANDKGLHRPEVSVLVSYSKMVMYEELLDSDFDKDPALVRTLLAYFPTTLSDNYPDAIQAHRLRSEIIATVITNEFINRLGPSFAFKTQEELGVDYSELAAAFVAVIDIFDMPSIWYAIEALDNKVDTDVQHKLQILVRGLVERATHWLVRSRRASQSIDEVIAQFKPGIVELVASLRESLAGVNRETLDQRVQYFMEAGVPEETALAVSQVVPLSSSLDIIEIATSVSQPVNEVAACYFALGSDLDLHWLRECIGDLRVRTHWHTLAKSELRTDLHYQQRHLCAEVMLNSNNAADAKGKIEQWAREHDVAVAKYRELIIDMKATSVIDFAMLSLAVKEVHKLLQTDRPLAATQR